ncbi:hypothetical protein [Eubacterium sp.]
MKKGQYSVKDYINSFNVKKKTAFSISVIFLVFYLLSIITYLIERADISLLLGDNIISTFTSMLTISFSISSILDVYLFMFPIAFIIINSILLCKNKYNKTIIVIDYLFQIISPVTIGFFTSAFLLLVNKDYPI